jgi:tetratricopeptide (TPR) repeat protein
MAFTNHRSGCKSVATALLLFLTLSSSPVTAQAGAPALLPPIAQEALDKGVLAAKVPDYLLAIRFFEEARQSAPNSPIVFLNLGLAESKIPGRELRAIAWLAAYLAVYPDAPNATAVRNQIALLHVTSQSNISRLIKAVQDAGTKAASSDRDSALGAVPLMYAKVGDVPAGLKVVNLFDSDVYKYSALSEIAQVQADAGEIESALKTTQSIENNYGDKCEALVHIAIRQFDFGDKTGASRTLDEALKAATLGEPRNKDIGLLQVAGAQAERNKIAEAQATAGQIQERRSKVRALAALATAQARNGNRADAQKSLAAAIQAVELTNDAVGNNDAAGLTAIAEAQTAMGDKTGALKSIDLAVAAAEHINIMFGRGAWPYIAEAQASISDTSGALKSYNHLVSTFPAAAEVTLILIVKKQINADDIAGARKTASLAKDQSTRATTQQLIATALAKKIPKTPQSLHPPASDWISKLDNIDPSDDCPLNTAPFLDLVAYLNSLPASEVAAATQRTARSIAFAQNVVDQMLKRQGLR